jgi:hypothetical protein
MTFQDPFVFPQIDKRLKRLSSISRDFTLPEKGVLDLSFPYISRLIFQPSSRHHQTTKCSFLLQIRKPPTRWIKIYSSLYLRTAIEERRDVRQLHKLPVRPVRP